MGLWVWDFGSGVWGLRPGVEENGPAAPEKHREAVGKGSEAVEKHREAVEIVREEPEIAREAVDLARAPLELVRESLENTREAAEVGREAVGKHREAVEKAREAAAETISAGAKAISTAAGVGPTRATRFSPVTSQPSKVPETPLTTVMRIAEDASRRATRTELNGGSAPPLPGTGTLSPTCVGRFMGITEGDQTTTRRTPRIVVCTDMGTARGRTGPGREPPAGNLMVSG